MKITINLGLETNKNETLHPLLALNEVITQLHHAHDINFKELKYRLDESTTEETLIVTLEPVTSINKLSKAIQKIADNLDQDCIAIKDSDNGRLIYSTNPLNDWGEFKQEYFIEY